MELDDLKNTWKKVTDAEKQHYTVSKEDLNGIIRRRSHQITAKFSRSFFSEMAIVSLCYLVIVFSAVPWYFKVATLSILTFLSLPFIKPFIRFYRLLKNSTQHPIDLL